MPHAPALRPSPRFSRAALARPTIRPRRRLRATSLAANEGRARIMEAALPLFLAHGYHATPVREIADAAGISVGTIFNCFTSKDDLLESIVDEHLAVVTQALREAEQRLVRGGAPPQELFVEVFRDYARSMLQLARFFTLVAQEAKSLSTKRRVAVIASEDRAAQLLRTAARAATASAALDRQVIDFKVQSLVALVRFWSDPGRAADLGASALDRLTELASAMILTPGAPLARPPAPSRPKLEMKLLCV